MKKDQGNITDDLLVKYLLRETSAAEDEQVQEWVGESRENKDHIDQLRLIWNQSKALAVAGGTPTDEAWEQFKKRLDKPATITIPRRSFSWLRIAALLVLLAGAGTIVWFVVNKDAGITMSRAAAPAQTGPATTGQEAANGTPGEMITIGTRAGAGTASNAAEHKGRMENNAALKGSSGDIRKDGMETFYNQYRTNDFVCNGTPCPLEICIIQSIKCPGGKPSAVATCSVLMPDQSGQVRYKPTDKLEENCNVTVQQIRIKRLTTGETIVLDENSQPSTAEEVFNYITGRKKGNILAGMFHSDCNNNDHEHTLKLDNNFGNLVLQ